MKFPPGGPDIDVTNAILFYVADVSATFDRDGRLRPPAKLREFVLGGVTHSMFRSLTIPALMSH